MKCVSEICIFNSVQTFLWPLMTYGISVFITWSVQIYIFNSIKNICNVYTKKKMYEVNSSLLLLNNDNDDNKNNNNMICG